MNIVQFLSHSIEEFDQLRLHTENGHTVFSPGAYINPRVPMDDKRPALDIDPIHDLRSVVDALGQPTHPKHGRCDGLSAHRDPLDAVKRDTPDEIIEWADVLIVHHLEHTWLAPQWDRFKGQLRVIWRTVGQSGDANEQMMAPLRREGLEIVRYSPREKNIPGFAGQDALIRFYKDPDEYGPWNGSKTVVTNVTQSLYRRSLADDGMLQPRGFQWTSYSFWDEATKGLPRVLAGPESEGQGGLGSLDYEDLKQHLRDCRAYLYTGTQPASYTLGLIEALMSGIPLVGIGPAWFRILPYGSEMFEGHEIAPIATEDPEVARKYLKRIILDDDYAKQVSQASRHVALEMFAKDKIKAEWQAYLDEAKKNPTGETAGAVPEMVAA